MSLKKMYPIFFTSPNDFNIYVIHSNMYGVCVYRLFSSVCVWYLLMLFAAQVNQARIISQRAHTRCQCTHVADCLRDLVQVPACRLHTNRTIYYIQTFQRHSFGRRFERPQNCSKKKTHTVHTIAHTFVEYYLLLTTQQFVYVCASQFFNAYAHLAVNVQYTRKSEPLMTYWLVSLFDFPLRTPTLRSY